MEEQKRIER